MTSLQAVLCDMDGTLVDTEPYWEAAKLNLAAHYGVPFTAADAEQLVGRSMMVTVHAMQAAGVPLSDAEVLDALVDEVAARVGEHLPWLPGAEAFLVRMTEEYIPCALVTQAWAPVAKQVVEASDGVLQVLVSGGDVTHPKPHPEPYLLAAGRLGVDANRCVAIEDSPSGADSANAAGAPVLVLPGVHPVPSAPRRHFIQTLDTVDRTFLEHVLNQP